MRLQIQFPTMERGQFFCNGESQPAMLLFASGRVAAIKPVKDPLALFLRDSGSIA